MFKIEGRLVLSEFGVKVFKFEQYFRNGILQIYTINTLNFIQCESWEIAFMRTMLGEIRNVGSLVWSCAQS